MKMVMIIYSEGLEGVVKDTLNTHNINIYTKWEKVIGQGELSDPHHGTHIWPKSNNILMIAMENEQAKVVFDEIRELRSKYSKEGIKAFAWSVDDMT